jgi:hypothetical protein
MNGYKRVRRELGTVAYEIQRRPNAYEQFYEKEAEAVREFVKHTKPSPKEKEDEPKTVEIKEKKNKMEDIMALINDTGETTENTGASEETKETKDTEIPTPKPETPEKDIPTPKPDTPKQVGGGSHMKTIRVTNVQADAKKNSLIL